MLDTLYQLSQTFLRNKNQHYRRYFITNTKLKERFSILKGQRGIGKTTTIVQYLLDYVNNDYFSPKILYIQSDHFALGKMTLYEIAEQFSLIGGEFIAFDEIHKYQDWSKELKSIDDTFTDLKIIASGSSALEIQKGSHDLSRRAITYNIHGLSFREYLELALDIKLPVYKLNEIFTNHQTLAEKIVGILSKKKQKILSHFHHYLHHGYYPYFNELKDEASFKITLEQNMHTTLESDLVSIYPQLTGNSIAKMKRLLIFIAQNVPFVPNWRNLKSLLEMGDERTLKTYFKYLEDAQLIQSLYSSSKKLQGIENPAKVYLQNPNLIYAIAKDCANVGTIRELFFANMLSHAHKITIPLNGDFLVDEKSVVEIGGQKKGFQQIRDQQEAYVAADNIEIGITRKVPLWLFGFLY